MSTNIETLKTRLNQAEEAYHVLMLGGSVRVVVDQNSERVEYTAANRQNLLNYIVSLRSQICAINPSDPVCTLPGGTGRYSGPMGVTF